MKRGAEAFRYNVTEKPLHLMCLQLWSTEQMVCLLQLLVKLPLGMAPATKFSLENTTYLGLCFIRHNVLFCFTFPQILARTINKPLYQGFCRWDEGSIPQQNFDLYQITNFCIVLTLLQVLEATVDGLSSFNAII